MLDGAHGLSAAIEASDLSLIHLVACLLGALMAVYVMQLWSSGRLSIPEDCFVSYHLRRVSLMILALAMLWALSYSLNRGWQPWVPYLMMLFGIDLFLLSAIIVSVRRRNAQARRDRLAL